MRERAKGPQVSTTDELLHDETTETPEPQEETTETQPTEKTADEIAAEWLKSQGIDPETFDAKKVANLSGWERKLNSQSTELGAIAKQLDAAKPATAPAGDDFEFDPETLKQGEALIAKVLGVPIDFARNSLLLSQQQVVDGNEQVFEEFTASHPDVDPTELVGEMLESGIDPAAITPARLRKELQRAYKVKKADALDPEAIAKKAVEDYLANLNKQGVGEDDIVEVKKGRGSAAGSHRTMDDVLNDPNVSIFDKMNAVSDNG